MAIDPYPSNRRDAVWDDFTAAHTVTKPEAPDAAPRYAVGPHSLPLAGPAALNGLDVQGLIRTVTQAQQVQSAIIDPEKPKVPVWAKGETAKVVYWSGIMPTLVTGCANLAVHEWGMAGPGWTGGLLTVAFAALGVSGLNHHWDMKANALTLGATVGSASFATAATGSGWMDVTAWLIAAAGTVGFKIVWNRKHAAAKAKEALTLAKVRTEQAKGDAVKSKSAINDAYALLRLQEAQRAAAAAVAPAMPGATPEERALRCAVWDVFGEHLTSCDVAYSQSGYVATLGLPVALPRNAFRNGWDKVSNALRVDGRFIVADGRLSNELEVRYVAASQLNTDTTWYPGREGIGLCTVTWDVVDVPVEGVHSMTGGRTNMGKSAYARIQLMRTVMDPKRAGIVIDPKRAEAVAWLGKLRVAGATADLDARYEEIYDMLCELMAEFRHRQNLFPGLYWEASEEYPTLFITLDEGAALKRMAEYERAEEVEDARGNVKTVKVKPFEDALDIAETLYGEARVVGMYFNWASQYLAKGTSIPQLVKENVGAVIGLTTLGGEGDRMLFGEEAGAGGWSPSKFCAGTPGRALVKYKDRPSYPVQLWHVTGEHIASLPDAEPWRSRAHTRTVRPAAAVAQPDPFEGDPAEHAQHLRDAGRSLADIAAAVGKSKSWVAKYTEAE